MMLTAQQIYSEQVQRLSFAERLRLTALLLEDLQTALPPVVLPDSPRPRPQRGSGKHDISYMADDFDAPLDDMKEYSE
ncbi:MAG: hypothetical protein H7145_01420 [Akkermansiaceae bacterium]|nr:hypothetical protein [Armatimonadota bacterium]